jgi:hypothetical protein
LRPLFVIFIALALVAGGLWAGSSILFAPAAPAGSAVRPDIGATPTRARVASAETATRVARPSATAAVELVAEATPTPLPVEPATPVPEPPFTEPPVEAAAPTETPVVKADRIGGPVIEPNNHRGPRWVTLQAGHWRAESLPDELEHLGNRTGTAAGGVTEWEINVAVCKLAAQYLFERGYSVDILDATVPMSYTTDLFVAVHADGNDSPRWRGFKAVAPWVSVPASDKFVEIFYEEYGKATGLPTDVVTSVAMADYYAFNPHSYNHAIDMSRVPAAIIEMGFVTNALDRQVLVEQQGRVAWGIANAVDRFFRSGAVGNTPTAYPTFTPSSTPTGTPTSTATVTPPPTQTATETPSPVPTEWAPRATETALFSPTEPTATPAPPTSTSTATPSPSATPLMPVVTGDGRWLPPLAPNGRVYPAPGSKAPPVLLNEAADEIYFTPDGREVQQVWQQYYVPEIGRPVWRKGPLLYVRR